MVDAIPLLEHAIMTSVKHMSDVSGHVVLKTCNRFEIYVDSRDGHIKSEMEKAANGVSDALGIPGAVFVLEKRASAGQLFRVCSGMESLIVGEDQIQGQAREAFTKARALDTTTPDLECLFDRALRTGKRVRTETTLNKGSVSVGSAAVDLAEKIMGTLTGMSVAIIGAGSTSELIGKSLLDRGVNATFVSSRTFNKAQELAETLGGTAVDLTQKYNCIADSDIALVATSAPHIIINKEELEQHLTGRTKKLLIIDVSVPRNVDDGVSDIGCVELETLDGLKSIAEENAAARKRELTKAESIIEEELGSLADRQREIDADIVIREINMKIASIREEETRVAIGRAAAASDVNRVIEDFSKALVSKIMADTYERLKQASREGNTEICKVAGNLFGTDGGKDVS
jgi:glutamyl-tRNA reductase